MPLSFIHGAPQFYIYNDNGMPMLYNARSLTRVKGVSGYNVKGSMMPKAMEYKWYKRSLNLKSCLLGLGGRAIE